MISLHPQREMVTPGTEETVQPEIIAVEDEEYNVDDALEEEDSELLEDELRRLQKVNSVATIASL